MSHTSANRIDLVDALAAAAAAEVHVDLRRARAATRAALRLAGRFTERRIRVLLDAWTSDAGETASVETRLSRVEARDPASAGALRSICLLATSMSASEADVARLDRVTDGGHSGLVVAHLIRVVFPTVRSFLHPAQTLSLLEMRERYLTAYLATRATSAAALQAAGIPGPNLLYSSLDATVLVSPAHVDAAVSAIEGALESLAECSPFLRGSTRTAELTSQTLAAGMAAEVVSGLRPVRGSVDRLDFASPATAPDEHLVIARARRAMRCQQGLDNPLTDQVDALPVASIAGLIDLAVQGAPLTGHAWDLPSDIACMPLPEALNHVPGLALARCDVSSFGAWVQGGGRCSLAEYLGRSAQANRFFLRTVPGLVASHSRGTGTAVVLHSAPDDVILAGDERALRAVMVPIRSALEVELGLELSCGLSPIGGGDTDADASRRALEALVLARSSSRREFA